ncbi:hypothetical protein [Polyangium fumosum]|nr:hypothetical protein [Polyangium fumosum]
MRQLGGVGSPSTRDPVVWEDREVFRIDSPKADTIERLTTFLSTYRSR